jgi:hypothetical protein
MGIFKEVTGDRISLKVVGDLWLKTRLLPLVVELLVLLLFTLVGGTFTLV